MSSDRTASASMIAIADCRPKGRGVVALRAFREGELIERAHIVLIPHAQLEHLEKTILSYYAFSWGPELNDGAIATGLGCFYNHSFQPNADYIKRMEETIIDFVAIRDIAANEEITVNYNGLPHDDTPLWFDRHRWGWFHPDGRRDDAHGP